MNSLPKTVTRQRRGCDLNPGPFAPESSTLNTRLPSHHGPSLKGLKYFLKRVVSNVWLILGKDLLFMFYDQNTVCRQI